MGNGPAGELAARLRALKERSGLSYGALARRLHTSTSTLHRYCSGAVVPADYPAVERLAAACGARPEELLELHRLWLAADGARGRAGQEPEPEPAAAPEPEESVPVPAPTAVPAPVPAAAPAAWRGRRPWGVLAAAVLLVALVGGWGLWRATGPGGEGASDAAAPGDARGEGEAAPRQAAGQPPLAYAVRSHVWAEGCGHRYLVDRAPEAVPAPPVAQDAEAWAAELGAVHGESTIVEATLTGTASEPVVIEALHLRVVERRAPLGWTAYDMSSGCGGALTPAAFTADLDAERPQLRPRDGYDAMSERELTPPTLPFAVSREEPLALRIEAEAAECDCDWYVEVEWTSGDEGGTLRLDDGGAPFRTSGAGAEGALVHDHVTGEWTDGGW